MKLKTRLFITFATIIILPLLLTSIAFVGIGINILRSSQQQMGKEGIDYALISDTIENYGEANEELFLLIRAQTDENPDVFEDETYLQELKNELYRKSSYVIVRKGEELYYTTNPVAAESIFYRLPKYGQETGEADTGYYFSDLQKLVKQDDFTFSDGTPGSVFVITKINTIISKKLLMDMFVAIIFILMFTSSMLTRWIHKGVFIPIRELNTAMQKIAEGDLDYSVSTNLKGELGSLYENYEQMRLRLKESTEEKDQSDSQNKELISNISHDLKTPITAIRGYVEGIMDGVADTPEKMDKYIRIINTKANELDRLINELTVYSGLDTNRIPYKFHCINVYDYFGDCVEEVGLDLDSKDIQLNYENLLPADTKVIADPEQMKRVIYNIIGNSMKYMDKKEGVIDIRILDEVDSIRVEIEDNGKGIAPRDLPKIFDRFYRTDASRNSSQGGSGIGLSIVKKIIEDHGGYIWATSREKEGTCLHFVLRKYREVDEDE